MASKFRNLIASKVCQTAKDTLALQLSEQNLSRKLVLNNLSSNCEFFLPLQGLFSGKNKDLSSASKIIKNFPTNETLCGIVASPPAAKNPKISFKLNKNLFIKEVLQNAHSKEWWKSSSIFRYDKKKVVVEFSSPNVAKPFHVGHLRSTIIGSFVANLMAAAGHSVLRLNYLGDWGTQFGFLQVGLQMGWYSWQEIKKDPINILLDIYVRANGLAKNDERIEQKARECFTLLENGNPKYLEDWKIIREYTVKELRKVYSQIGIRFDEFHGESMYRISEMTAVTDRLKSMGLLQQTDDGKWVVRLNDRPVTVIKSDGSSLYISRDIAAAMDRFQRYRFDRMIYVVDNGQSDHFQSLKGILKLMGEDFEPQMEHVKFGRIRGMSTRKGTAVFLKDVLDEARDRVRQKQLETLTTKVNVERDLDVTEILAASAVIINDLKQRRQNDYEFEWEKALQQKGDSGIRLQYTHARLCSLQENCGIRLDEPDFAKIGEILNEPQALQLVLDIAKFDEVLMESYEQLEPCIVINYLFRLSHAISGALKVLPVKDQDERVAEARLVLFTAAKETLSSGMKLVGLQPLEKM